MIIGIDANPANRGNRSGIGWYTFHIIEALKKLSARPEYKEVRFRLYSSEPLRADLAQLPENWESRVLRWIRLPGWNLWTQLRLSWEMVAHKPDVFFSPGYTLPLVHPRRSVVVIHDIAFKHHPEYYSKFWSYYHRLITAYSLQTAHSVITPSQYTKDDIVKGYRYPPGLIAVIPLATDPAFQKHNIDASKVPAVAAKYHLVSPYFIFISRLQAKKNVLGLVQAYAELLSRDPSAPKLALVGSPDFGWTEAESFIKEKNLAGQVMQLGYVPAEDLPFLLAGSQALVFPSLYEGFGLPVLEAMSAGVPVITSNTTSLPEAAGSAALLVDPNNKEELVAAMSKLAHDSPVKNTLVEQGLEQAQKFSWERTAIATLDWLIKST